MAELGEQETPLVDRDWLSHLRERLQTVNDIVVCLDFDGTLAPIVPDPEAAALAPGNHQHLERLVDHQDVTVAVVSGRSLADLRDRIDVDGLHYAGNHGLEWADGDGRTIAAEARETQDVLQKAHDTLRSRLANVSGCTIEDKELTLTVHYRRVADSQVPGVIETAETVAMAYPELKLCPGKEIVEIRPNVSLGKDLVVERLRQEHSDALFVFVGDDVTDEDGFEAVEPDGYGILVGDRSETAASVRVPDTDGVTLLLAWLVHEYVEDPDEE